MVDRTREQAAKVLNELLAKQVNTVNAKIRGGASPGQTVTFTYTNPIDGKVYTGQGTVFTACSSPNVTAVRKDDGSWVIFDPNAGQGKAETVLETRRARPSGGSGKIKILLSRTLGGRTALFVAGDRPNPFQVFMLPEGANLQYAHLDNLGSGNRWIITVVYSIGTQQTVITLESGGRKQIDLTQFTVGSGSYFGHGFYNLHTFAAPAFQNETEGEETESPRNLIFTGTGYTESFTRNETSNTTYSLSENDWQGSGTGSRTYEESGTNTLTGFFSNPPAPGIPSCVWIFREGNPAIPGSVRYVLQDFTNDFYGVVPPTVRDALLLDKQVEFIQNDPNTPLVRRYFKIQWDSSYEEIVTWNVDSDPLLGPSYVINRYNSGQMGIDWTSGTFSSTEQRETSQNATGTNYALDRDQVLTNSKSYSYTNTYTNTVSGSTTVGDSTTTEELSGSHVLAPGLIKSEQYSWDEDTNGLLADARYRSILVGRGEAIYTYQTVGIVPVLRYWRKGSESSAPIDIDLPEPLPTVPEIDIGGDLHQGIYYRITSGIDLVRGRDVEVTQVVLRSMAVSKRKYSVFRVANSQSYGFWNASFHPY